MTPELIEKFSKLSEQYQNEVIELIEENYHVQEIKSLTDGQTVNKDAVAFGIKFINEHEELFRKLADS